MATSPQAPVAFSVSALPDQSLRRMGRATVRPSREPVRFVGITIQ